MHIATQLISPDAPVTPPRPMVFLHGLMGRGRNFGAAAKNLTEVGVESLLVDLPNHGASDWTETFDYNQVADQVAELLAADFAATAPVVVLGHSLGGKVAMCLALRHPELVHALIVEDIAPAPTGNFSTFEHLLGSLKSIDLATISSRAEAEAQLVEKIPETGTRKFLLQNLQRAPENAATIYQWEPNLELLYDSLDTIADFPDCSGLTYDGPTLWIKGEHSPYIAPENQAAMKELFPKVQNLTIRGAGHWVHSEKQAEFNQVLRVFLDRVYPTANETASQIRSSAS